MASLAIAKVIDMTLGMRISPEEELEGLDRSQHAETAYYLDMVPSSVSTAHAVDVDTDRTGMATPVGDRH